jgi:hypothetical protein
MMGRHVNQIAYLCNKILKMCQNLSIWKQQEWTSEIHNETMKRMNLGNTCYL